MSNSESSRRFHFIREIASGGFGSVYLTKVIHADGFSRLVAVKLLHPRWSENEEIASRMRDEARLLGWLRHKNIVDVMDLTLIDGRCAVIMEYLDAVDFKEIIQHCVARNERVPLRPALEACAAVASALDAAYNRPPYAREKPLRVIHRDIKPSNIMIDDQGVVKVLDFGVARAEFDGRESKTEELAFGSLEYMPPERLFFEPESPASDVYSLGATLFELLALEKFGKARLRPNEHETFFEDRFDLLLDRYPMHQESEDLLHELLMGMLAFEAPDRPSAADAVSLLRSFARRITESSLEEWAERVVPPQLRIRAEEPETKSPSSLVGTVVSEDPKALDQRSEWDENTGVATRSVEMVPNADELTGRLADDARWQALKQATIDDMAKRGELQPGVGSPVPISRSRQPFADNEPTISQRSPFAPIPPPVVASPTPPPAPRIDAVGAGMAFDAPEAELAAATTVRLQRNDPAVQDAMGPDADPTVIAKRPSMDEPSSGPPTEPPTRSKLVNTALAAMLAGAAVALVAAALFLLIAAVVVGTGGGSEVPAPKPASVPAPSPTPEAVPAPATPDPVAPTPAKPVVEGPSTLFSSAVPDLKKFVVNCTGGRGSGTSEVSVAGKDLGRCSIVGIPNDGPRLRATIEEAGEGPYTCFTEDGECTGP